MSEHHPYRTPGQYIAAEIARLGWEKQVCAQALRVSPSMMSKMISDVRPIDAEMALNLQDTLGLDASLLLQLQKDFDLAQAKLRTRPEPGRLERAHLFGDLPVKEIVQRGWLPGVSDWKDIPSVEAGLMKFFKVTSLKDIEILPFAPKRTQVHGPVTAPQMMWIYRVKEVASEMLVGRYSPAGVKALIPKLETLLMSPEAIAEVPKLLGEVGIRFVIVESLKSAKIDGATLWLDDFSPVIGMTLRFDRLDNFWFVLRHECEHVIQMHGKTALMLDFNMESGETVDAISEEERVANEAATAFCVPPDQMKKFWDRKHPVFAERDIIGFARTIKVHPALVAGQLRRRLNSYNRFTSLMVKVRSLVAPAATVDGWGDIVPLEPQA